VRERTLAFLSSPPGQCGVERPRWRLEAGRRRMIGVGAQGFSRRGVRQGFARLDSRDRRGWE
jgi:hypothetical protein